VKRLEKIREINERFKELLGRMDAKYGPLPEAHLSSPSTYHAPQGIYKVHGLMMWTDGRVERIEKTLSDQEFSEEF
jgi:hypothetical protein